MEELSLHEEGIHGYLKTEEKLFCLFSVVFIPTCSQGRTKTYQNHKYLLVDFYTFTIQRERLILQIAS